MFTSERLADYETPQSECICLEFTIANRKLISLNICKLSNLNNMIIFFGEITTNLSKAAMDNENIIIMEDLTKI